MNALIPPEFGTAINDLVAAGIFPTAEAVVSEALRRLLKDQASFDELKATFDKAIAELDRGGETPLDFAEIKRKGRELAAARHGQ